MAKGDKTKVQNKTDVARGRGEALNTNVREGMINPTTTYASDAYRSTGNEAMGDYRDIMNQYKNFQSTNLQPSTFERVNYNRSPEMQSALSGYQGFADNGGFNDDAIRDMRARGISPIRSVYANAVNEMARQKNLSGGYAPNMPAAMERMRGSTSQQIADQVQNVNASLAEMQQKGRLQGLEGLGGLSTQDMNFAQQAALANQSAGLRTNELNRTTTDPMRLNAIQGQASLFGTTPGMANMFGNQVLDSTRNAMQNVDQDTGIQQNAFNNQMGVAATPSNFQVGAGRLATGIDYGAKIAGAAAGLPGGIKPPIPSSRVKVPGMYGAY